ncbi:MAG: cation:dicarboxylase symporter family transporter [Desulfovibrionaceae bacterium]
MNIGKKPVYKTLYFWVIFGIVAGIVLGLVPATKSFANQMQPFGVAFIRMVKMIIAPIIFCTVVTGIAKMGDMGKVGRVGIKCMVYFWTMTLFALANLGERARGLVRVIDEFSRVLFKVVHYIMYFAPFGAFGAIAYVVASQGAEALYKLLYLMLGVYSTCILFIFGVLFVVCRLAGFSLWRYLCYIQEEILLVLGTSSSEAALPRMMAKLENAGADKSVVGLCLPMGYSFNLDGTCIYLTMAAVFLAQATGTPLDLSHQIYLLFILLLTSKGAAAVTGGGFITLAATLQTVGTIPVASLTLLLGVDRFMSEARVITNMIGNGIATIVVAKWENALDTDKLQAVLAGTNEAYADDPEDRLIIEESAHDAERAREG